MSEKTIEELRAEVEALKAQQKEKNEKEALEKERIKLQAELNKLNLSKKVEDAKARFDAEHPNVSKAGKVGFALGKGLFNFVNKISEPTEAEKRAYAKAHHIKLKKTAIRA